MPSPHDCRQELRAASLKITEQRLGVLHVLEHAQAPVDAATIHAFLRKQDIEADEVTVFRILNTFVSHGLANPVQFDEGKKRFEYANKPSHHHFVCMGCGIIADVTGCTVDTFEKKIEQMHGFKIERHALEFFGRCQRCIS